MFLPGQKCMAKTSVNGLDVCLFYISYVHKKSGLFYSKLMVFSTTVSLSPQTTSPRRNIFATWQYIAFCRGRKIPSYVERLFYINNCAYHIVEVKRPYVSQCFILA